MSFVAVSWAIQQKIEPFKFRVLIALADRQNSKSLQCNPSFETIAADTGIAERTVMNAIKWLETAGLIEVRRRHRRSSQYDLRTDLFLDSEDKPVKQAARPKFPDLVDLMGAGDAPMSDYPAGNAPYAEPFLSASDDNPRVSSEDTPIREEELGKKNTHTPTREENDDQPKPKAASRASSPKKRPTQLAEEWTPGDAGFLYAREQGIDPDRTLADFRDYYIGKGTTWVDWYRVWQKWCRSASDRATSRPAARRTRPHVVHEDMADTFERAKRWLRPNGE